MSKEEPGYCCAYPTNEDTFKKEIEKPLLKTSDLYVTCNLPKRFEHPHWFNGYGCQLNKEHPLYRTTSSEYGWFPPSYCSVPTVFYPQGQKFTNHLSASGMYRNYSLNTGTGDHSMNNNCLLRCNE